MTDLTTKLVFAADTAGAEAGVGRVKRSLADLGTSADAAGKKASEGFDGVGKGAGASAQKIDSATKNMVASIQRTIAAFEAGDRSGVKFFESIAKQRGVSTDTLRPFLDQLAAAKKTAEEAGHGMEEFGFKTAGAKRELLVLAHELSQGNFKRAAGSMLVLGERTGAAGLLFSKTTLAVVGVTAALAGLGAAVLHAENLQRELNTLAAQMTATGRAGVISTDGLKAFIKELSLLPGVSRESATAVVSEFTKVHQIGGALFGDLVRITADYAKATGTDAPEAAKALAKAFADPEKGAQALDAALGTLSSTTLLQIEKMTQMNDIAGAQRVLFDALQHSVGGLSKEGTDLEHATHDLAISWHHAMDEFDNSSGLRQINRLLVETVGLVKYLVENFGKLGGLATVGAGLTGGIPGAVAGGLGSYLHDRLFSSGSVDPSGRIASGKLEGAAPATVGASAGTSVDDRIKGALKLGSAYEGVNGTIERLTRTQTALREAQALAAKEFGKSSDQYKKLGDEIEGVNEAIDRARKKGDHKEKAFTDDAATRMLETLRQTQATLQATLAGEDKLTEAQREQAKFQQLIADLKEKRILTAEQKSLLAAKDSINAQLSLNVALDQQIEAKKKAAELQQIELGFAKQMEAIARSIAASQQSRNEQYDRVLSTAGLGDRAGQQVLAQKDLDKEHERNLRSVNDKAAQDSDDAAKKGIVFDAFGTDEYKAKIELVETAYQKAKKAQAEFFDALKAQREDWKNGATTAIANYLDQIDDAARRAQTLVTTGLTDLTDGITGLITGDKKLASFKDYGKKIAEQIVKGMVEQNVTKPIAEWLQGSLKDPSSIISKLLGGLTGNQSAGSGLTGLLGGLGGGSGAVATATMATSASAAATALAALTEAASAAATAMGGSAASSDLTGALSTANSIGNSGGDALGSLISSMGWAEGGYTGAGAKYQPAGIVHAGEYVVNAASTSKLGVGFLDQLNRRGYADGGLVASLRGAYRGPAANDSPVGGGRPVQIVMNVPKGTDTKTAGQWGAAAARQLRISQARYA